MLRILGIENMPLVSEGDDLGELIALSLRESGLSLKGGDLVVVAQTIVSKSEGRVVGLDEVSPGREAEELARITGKDPRLVEVIVQESKRVITSCPGFMLCETRDGFVCANAGVDRSNNDPGVVSKLPLDPHSSAKRISGSLRAQTGVEVPVIISDSQGRPFRRGAIGVAVGVHGLAPVRSLSGERDLMGRELETTEISVADMIASAATLVMGEAGRGIPVVLVRCLELEEGSGVSEMGYQKDIFKELLSHTRKDFSVEPGAF